MCRKKSKKAVKKVVSSGVRWVPSAFDDNLFLEAASQKGSCFWPLFRFNFQDNCPSGSESEFVDIDSFLDGAPEVRKEVLPMLLLRPLLLLLLLMFLCLSTHVMMPLPNLPRSSNSPFTGVMILSRVLPCLKFAK
jgi:hypothetical protein